MSQAGARGPASPQKPPLPKLPKETATAATPKSPPTASKATAAQPAAAKANKATTVATSRAVPRAGAATASPAALARPKAVQPPPAAPLPPQRAVAPSAPKFADPTRASAPSQPQTASDAPSLQPRTASRPDGAIPSLPAAGQDEPTIVARPPMMAVGPPPLPVGPSPDEVEARVRAAVEAAVRPLQMSVLDLQRQLDEARLLAAPRDRAPSRPDAREERDAATVVAPRDGLAGLSLRARSPSRPDVEKTTVQAAPPRAVQAAAVPAVPAIDLAAIARGPSIEIDAAFDGAKRRRRAVFMFVLMILAVFGALGAALASSYAHR